MNLELMSRQGLRMRRRHQMGGQKESCHEPAMRGLLQVRVLGMRNKIEYQDLDRLDVGLCYLK